jgi:tRNA pseudouridine38-40 synthase
MSTPAAPQRYDRDEEDRREVELQRLQRFRVVVSYDGTDYNGWQVQKQQRGPTAADAGATALQRRNLERAAAKTIDTIQGRIEKRLTSIFSTPVVVAGSGRTDSGVHADAQVFHFDAPRALKLPDSRKMTVETTLDAAMVELYLRNGLPRSILVRSAEAVPRTFHARESCVKKRYQYSVAEGAASPFHARFCHSLSHGSALDLALMRAAAAHLVGQHDFSAFGVIEAGDPRSPVKNMTVLDVVREEGGAGGVAMVRITAVCDRFLWHMMRMIAGTLVEVGLGRMTPDAVKGLIDDKARGPQHTQSAGRVRTAPAQGLCLKHVFYDE